MWFKRILILGAVAVGAAAVTVAGPMLTPVSAEPCDPVAAECSPAPPPPPAAECDLEAAFRNDPICGVAEVSGGM